MAINFTNLDPPILSHLVHNIAIALQNNLYKHEFISKQHVDGNDDAVTRRQADTAITLQCQTPNEAISSSCISRKRSSVELSSSESSRTVCNIPLK